MTLSLWDSYGLADRDVGAGNISEDSRGRWYIDICVRLNSQQGPRRSATPCLFGQTVDQQ
jgi:putative transposase